MAVTDSQVKTGRFAIIEQFLADGMEHMFGNPGTVEQGFLDALMGSATKQGFRYTQSPLLAVPVYRKGLS